MPRNPTTLEDIYDFFKPLLETSVWRCVVLGQGDTVSVHWRNADGFMQWVREENGELRMQWLADGEVKMSQGRDAVTLFS